MKMKNFKLYMLCLLVALMASCTRNDGDIGELYGMWRVTAIVKDGEVVKDYSGTLYFEFQSSVHIQKYVYEDRHERDDRAAMWRYQGEDVILEFVDFDPVEITGMQKGLSLVKVEECTGSNMVMSYESPENEQYRYLLKKW